MTEVGGWIQQGRLGFQLGSVSEMGVAQVARAVLGRPDVSGGRAYINAPILNCDTKSRADSIRIVNHLESCSKQNPPALLGLMGDGQSMIALARLKRAFPMRYRHVVILCGNFHAFGHFMFGCQEIWHDAFTGIWAKKLSKEKVPKLIPNFENDAYMHTLAHLSEITVGTLTYLLTDVTDPPPSLLLNGHASLVR